MGRTARNNRERQLIRGEMPVRVMLLMMLVTLLFTGTAFAYGDQTFFESKRYERAQGKPATFTNTFNGCASATQATITVQNGAGKNSSLTSAVITLNGKDLFTEADFKNQTLTLQKAITLKAGTNTLNIQLKSGGQKETPFLIITITGKSCGGTDTTPPVMIAPQPADGTQLNTSRPAISASYADNNGGSGIDTTTVKVTLDGVDITPACTVTTSAVSCLLANNLADGLHSATVTLSDLSKNLASYTWHFTTDTTPPRVTLTSPQNGQYLNNTSITVTGTIDDPLATVTVNGVVAIITGTTYNAADVPLAEGSNSIIAVAEDPAGNRDIAMATVKRDTIKPQILIATPADGLLTRNPLLTISGNVSEPVATLTVNGAAVAVAATAPYAFTCPLTLAEGQNSLAFEAIDRAGNKGNFALTVTRDSTPPIAPILNSIVTPTRIATTTVSGQAEPDSTVTLFNNGQLIATLKADATGLFTVPAVILIEGNNLITATATDVVMNVGPFSVPLTVVLDTKPPVITISAPQPGVIVGTPQVTITGTVDDAEATLTVGDAPITLTNKSFSVAYLLSDGDNTVQVKAVDKAGNEGTATVLITLDAQPPVVTLSAPTTATAGTDVQISVNANDNRSLSLIDLSADGATLWSASPTGATAEQVASFRLSPTLIPGATVTVRATALDTVGNSGSATAIITIDRGADGSGWLQGKVLDDSRGLPLEGAQISVTDAKGQQQNLTTLADGSWYFETASGLSLVEIAKGGFTTAQREVTVRPGQRTTVLDSRLTRIDGTLHAVGVVGGTVHTNVGTGAKPAVTVDIVIPANALSVPADLRLTPLSNQGLIASLPLGWSPLAAVELHLLDPITAVAIDPQPLTVPATLTLPLPTGLGDAALNAQLVRYDSSSRSWLAVAEVAIADKATTVAAQISQPGQYTLALADPAPLNPPPPTAGRQLAAASLTATDFSHITTAGRVVPQAAPPSLGLRAAGDLLLVAKADAATAPAPISGLVVNARVTEKFDLTSGSTLQPNATTQDIVLYRVPCATSISGGVTVPPFDSAQGPVLRTTFPVAPSRDFTIVDLLLGKISIDITQPDNSGGVMVGADGARLLQPDGTALSIPVGALTGTVPVTVTTLPEATVSTLVGGDFRLLRGVDVAITGKSLKSSSTMSIPVPAGFNPTLPVVVAKKFDVKGGSKLKLVGVGRVFGSIISSDATFTIGNETIATQGITTSGQYLFLQAVAPIGYVTGQVTGATAAAFAGIQLSAQSATLADLTGVNGQYLLALATGAQTVTALDTVRGDAASSTVTISSTVKAILNLTVKMVPPAVAAINPANSTINVQPTVPVVVTFSKAMDKATITSSTFVVRDATNVVVPGVLTFSVDNTTATFYPSNAFNQETLYRVTIAAIVKDLQGYPLGQDVVSSFTIRRTTTPTMPAAGAVSGTFPDADGFITVTGTQGSAAADNTVLLINDTTGEIQSVTPASNGSFTGKVHGQLGDQIKVVLMDYSGNQTTISYLTFKGPDDSYLVTAKGGNIEGSNGALLAIPEGALVGSTIIKVTPVQEANLPTQLQTPGKYLGAVHIDTGGIPFQKTVEISIPIPTGFDINNAVFITKPGKIFNADDTTEQVYEIIDSTKIVGNRITSACDPFPGVFGDTLVFTDFTGLAPIVVSGYAYQDRNDMPSYQAPPDGAEETPTKDAAGNLTYKYDRPIQGAVIRSPDAGNYVSYTNSKGFYGTFAAMAVLPAGFTGDDANCKQYRLTAINPQTMFKSNFDGYACASPYNVRNVNFKLADKDTIPPDRTAPVITMSLNVVPGQTTDKRIVAGTTPVGTKLNLPVSIIDQAMKSATLTVTYQETGSGSGTATPYLLTPPPNPVPYAFVKEEQANLYRYDYQAGFSSGFFPSDKPGYYTFTVEATDASGNKSGRSLQLHVVANGTDLGMSVDGPPRVDAIFPNDTAEDVMVTSQIVATFNEPVQNAETNFKLYDMDDPNNPQLVPSSVIVGIEGARMQATLIPGGNLYYSRKYKVVLTTGIKDIAINPSSPTPPPGGDGLYTLQNEFVSYFTTKVPNAYDLATNQQFSDGRDVDLYTFTDTNNETDTYAYVAAGNKGWRIVDVTDPAEPATIFTASSACVPNATSDCRYVGPQSNFRSVAVHPDKNRALMAMTENITFTDGNQYGYVRFYDLSSAPGNPPIIGREKLAEAYSGIPGRVALWGDYAVVSTAVAGIQIVNIREAIKNQADGKPSNGSSIAGILNTENLGYGSPNDLAICNERSAVFTTNPGYLLTVDLNLPTDQQSVDTNMPFLPVVISPFRPTGYSFTRVGVASGFTYTDSSGIEQTINLAVTGTTQGKVNTLDLSDPTNPRIIGTATQADGTPVTAYVRDISVSKDAGLAYVTTYNAIQVYDIKDPTKPRLLNEITSLPDPSGATDQYGNPVMIPIGETPAIIEKGGWVYLANMTKGIRTLDLDPVELTLETNSIKLATRLSGQALNDEVYFTYNLNGLSGFEPARSMIYLLEDGKEIWSKSGIPTVQGSHVIRYTAQELGHTFDVTKKYEAKVIFGRIDSANTVIKKMPDPEAIVRVPIEWQALATDYNRDGRIDATDLDYAAKGNIDRTADPATGGFPEAANKFYFWINDNADFDDTTGDSIPGSGNDFKKGSVQGTRDLVDYFPVKLDISDLLQKLPSDQYTYTLKQINAAVNYVDTVMGSEKTKNYLTDVTSAKSLESSAKTWINDNGVKLDNAFLQALLANNERVILVDGRAATRNPLVLEVWKTDKKDVAFRTELPLSIAGVEQMFRHKNLIEELYNIETISGPLIAGHNAPSDAKDRGAPNRLGNNSDGFTNVEHFKGFDAKNDGKTFIHVHGYNVNGQDARGEQAEVFKRLYWSGSNAKFWGITWYGWDSQNALKRAPNYHVNVRHAFDAGRMLKEFVKTQAIGTATFSAHSLGNMVVSAAIQNGMPYAHYIMANPAVAEEAYVPVSDYEGEAWGESTRPLMCHPDWLFPRGSSVPYQPFLWQSEWYELFPGTDTRNTLTWRNMFDKVRTDLKNYAFFSPTDQAFRPFDLTIPEIDAAETVDDYKKEKSDSTMMGTILLNWFHDLIHGTDEVGTYAFTFNEFIKGTELTSWILNADGLYGGWGFNLNQHDGYYKNVCTNLGDGDSCESKFIKPEEANVLDRDPVGSDPGRNILQTKPLFDRSNPDNSSLFATTFDNSKVTTALKERLLANEIPVLTFAVGHRGTSKFDRDRNINIRAKYIPVGTPWPRGAKDRDWRHSDAFDVAYPYVFELYDDWVKISIGGAL